MQIFFPPQDVPILSLRGNVNSLQDLERIGAIAVKTIMERYSVEKRCYRTAASLYYYYQQHYYQRICSLPFYIIVYKILHKNQRENKRC